MSVSLPIVLVIAIVAVVIGGILGRRRGADRVRGLPNDGVRVIRPPMPAQSAAVRGDTAPGDRATDVAPASALADAINRATEAAHVNLHVTPAMLANAKVTSNVSVSSSEGMLDPAQARAIMDAVSRAMAGQGGAALSPAVDAEVRALVAQGHMINAVKRVREATGLDLKHAKDVVDAMR